MPCGVWLAACFNVAERRFLRRDVSSRFCVKACRKYDHMHKTRQIKDYGGVANVMPRYAVLFMLFAMANAGLPGTSGFVGEAMVIFAAAGKNLWLALAAASAMITGAAYTLWMYRRVMFGEIANDSVRALKDINRRETAILLAFAALVIFAGLWPLPFTDIILPAAENLLAHIEKGKL